jgi:hypothetical protein
MPGAKHDDSKTTIIKIPWSWLSIGRKKAVLPIIIEIIAGAVYVAKKALFLFKNRKFATKLAC